MAFGERYGMSDYGKETSEPADFFCYAVYRVKMTITAGCDDGSMPHPLPACIYMEGSITKYCECRQGPYRDSGFPKFYVPEIVINPPDADFPGEYGGVMDVYNFWQVREENGPPCNAGGCKCEEEFKEKKWLGTPASEWFPQGGPIRLDNPVHPTPPKAQGTPQEIYQESIENFVKNKIREFRHCCEGA